MTDIRVRFAPSPTGSLHIGGARTALFNWLFARNMEGKFILRVEDTDTQRSTEDSARGIIEGLQWLGLDWDEGPGKGGLYGPYRQSERLPIYNKHIKKLLDNGKAYLCFCTPEELHAEREKASKEKKDYKYNGKCRGLSELEKAELLQSGRKPVVRIKTPETGKMVVHDLIRGDVEFSNSLLDDFIIAKSDGWPTYNFAVVVDDSTMKISHVIRAEEHLSNTPRQLIIYEALGLPIPEFAHVSMILAPDRSKLSKRHGATSVQEFRDQGYLPEALLNYLALLGWSSGEDVDFWEVDEMIKHFSLKAVSRSAAIYDVAKLSWMNGHYLAEAGINRIVALLENEAGKRGWLKDDNRDYFVKVVALLQSRLKILPDFFDNSGYFFEDVAGYDEKGLKKYFGRENSREILMEVLQIIDQCRDFQAASLEDEFRRRAEVLKLKAADLIHPARLAVSGRTSTPGIFEVMELLGREICRSRTTRAADYIKNRSI
ncbi:MAG: glutamate--tRNA ligase [Syntrophomonas sp.]